MGAQVQIIHIFLVYLALLSSPPVEARKSHKCEAPKAISDATYEYKGIRLPDGRFNEGAIATYTCNQGYTKGLDSNDTATCVLGSWQGVKNFRCCRVDICIDPNLHCTLPKVDGASLEIVSGNESFSITDKKMGYGIGTAIRYDCHQDYNLRNDSTNGPFTCMHGGKWSPDKFTKCDEKVCPEPPSISNGNLKTYSKRSTYPVGTLVEYECNSGYDMVLMSYAHCNSKLEWIGSLGVRSTIGFDMDYPQCINRYVSTYGSGDTSYGSGGSYGSSSNSNDWSYKTKKKEWTAGNTISIILVIVFVVAVISCVIWRNSGNSSRRRAVIVNGVTTTEYVGPNTYCGPPPTLTTGPPMISTGPPTFTPSRSPTAAQYSPNNEPKPGPPQMMAPPPEMIPLAPQLPRNPYDGPPNYEQAMNRNIGTGTAPSAPFL